MFSRLVTWCLVLTCLAPLVAAAQAPGYPTRPIRVIVAYPPGGSTDVAARLIAEPLSKALGQPVVVENKAGAGGTIGASFSAKTDPDGYTLHFGSAAEVSIAPVTVKDVSYDILRDFQPITLVGSVPFLLVTNAALPPNNLRELLAWIKANPGKANYSSFGNNTTNHLVGEAFKLEAGVQATHVPYKGSGPSIADLVGGQVQYTFDTITATLPQVRAGRLKAIAVATPKRSPLVPDTPTLSESGLPGFTGGTWFGLLAPKGTPAPIVDRLHRELSAILRSEPMKGEFEKRGIEPVGNTPQEFSAFIRSESERWRQLATRINLKPE
jgi:tripartite-type tricarboxylate transporter receptor subunit TctC